MDVFEAIAKEADEKTSQLKNHIASGRATTYEEYKYLCGQIQGLLYAKDYALGLRRQIEESE